LEFFPKIIHPEHAYDVSLRWVKTKRLTPVPIVSLARDWEVSAALSISVNWFTQSFLSLVGSGSMKIGRFVIVVTLHLGLFIVCASAAAQNVVRIEEDWALQVLEPDEQLNSPQIMTAMMPFGPNSSTILYLDINHGSSPDYSSGGLQLRIDRNGEGVDSKRLLAGQKLSRAAETIKWTQVAIRQGNQLKFGILRGQSQSWDSFGGSDAFIDVTSNSEDLDAYRHTDSLSNSGAVYADNRVASLTLLRLRVFNSLGQMVEVPINESPQ